MPFLGWIDNWAGALICTGLSYFSIFHINIIYYVNAKFYAGVAQLAEQLICNQQVAGSSPITSSKSKPNLDWALFNNLLGMDFRGSAWCSGEWLSSAALCDARYC